MQNSLLLSSSQVVDVSASADGTGTLMRFCLSSNTTTAGWQQTLSAQAADPQSRLYSGDTTAATDSAFGVQTAPDPNAPGSSGSGLLEGNNLYYIIGGGALLVLVVAGVLICWGTKSACFAPSSKSSASTSASSVSPSHKSPAAVEFSPVTPSANSSSPAPSRPAPAAPAPAAAVSSAAASASASTSDDGSNWTEQESDGRRYYWNKVTGESSWTRKSPPTQTVLRSALLCSRLHVSNRSCFACASQVLRP